MTNQESGSAGLGHHEEIKPTVPASTSAKSELLPDAPKPPEAKPAPAPPSDDNEDEAPLHLEFRAPTFQHQEEKISKWGMRLAGFSAEWQTQGETQCIRHKITAVSRTIAFSISHIVNVSNTVSYDETFPRVHADLELGGQNILGHHQQHRHGENGTASVSGRGDGDGVLSSEEIHLAPVEFRYEKSVAKPGGVALVPSEVPRYVVLGIFSGASGIPKERMVNVKDSSWLFWSIFWAVVRLRGVGYFMSLKDVKAFSVYKCNWRTGVHKRVSLEQKGTNDLRLLWLAYKSWWNSDRIGEGWTNWIHRTINNSSTDPRADSDGNSLSIEIVMGWSPFRISVVILLPTLLSLVIGLWFNSRDWNDTTTIQTAWGIASYVATAGGLIAALLGFISGIKDE